MSFIYVLAGIFIFGFLIAVHELGHFLAARLCGVRVNEFSIGMGPLLWRRETGETRYSLRLLPIGGFCAMGEDEEDTGDERSFAHQGFWKKLVILAAGSFMNLLAGVAVIACIYATATGFYVDQVAGFSEGFPLEGEDGLMEGDIFYKIDGWRTYLRGDAALFLRFNDGQGCDVEVIRDGERVVLKDLPLYRGTYDGQEGRFGLMVGAARVPATFFTTVKFIGYQTLDVIQQVWFSLIQLLRGNVGLSEVSGPVGIVSTMKDVGNSSKTALDAFENIAFFGAFIAINLAVMNLLPIPALDGGRIFFLAVDGISLLLFKRKVPEKYQAAVNTACFVLLMGVMLLVTLKDVGQLFMRGGS